MINNFLKFNKNFFLKSGFISNVINFFIFLFVVAVILTVFLFFKFRSIYQNFYLGQQDLSYSLQLIFAGDFNGAREASYRANNNFISASESLQGLQSNFFIERIAILNNNLNDFKKISQVAMIISKSSGQALLLINDIEEVFSGNKFNSFLDLSDGDRLKVLSLLYENYPEMQGVKANIDLSLFYLNQVNKNRLLLKYSDQFVGLGKKLEGISSGLDKIISFAGVIPVLSGYPEKASYLIIFQNNNELRPTGGFIGSYGIMDVEIGDIVRLETHDIYHLDMPASLNSSFNIPPPEPIKKYLGVNKWFMRDANWSPDWPSAAQKLQWFYNEELLAANRFSELENFSGVIAINPELISDLLYVVGPIEVSGQVYNKDNFMSVLQYEVEMAFREDGVSEWDRKLIIGEILKSIKDKLFSLPLNRWEELVGVFNKNINQKNVLVYLNDDYSRKVSSGLNWGGELKDNSGDYLMVVDANLAAFKTDRVMDKKIKYYLNEEAERFKVRLELSYQNNGWFDWQTTRYRSFTRIYVPYNSVLLSSTGSPEKTESGKDDSIVNPKTYFSNFISVEPGQSRTLILEYYLSDDFYQKFKKDNIYSLLIQKQPGSNVSQIEIYLDFLENVDTVFAQGEIEVDKNIIYWKSPLDKDCSLEIKF